MKKKLLASVSALTAAASLLLGSLPAMPASAEGIRTGKDLKSSCQYVLTPQGDDAVLKRGTPKEVMQGDFGVPATEKVTQFWMELECDASSGLATMPVFAYDAPGYGEYDWYYDALYLEAPDEHMTIIFNPHPDYPVPNKIQLQLWGDDGKALDSVTIKNLGIVTDGGADIAQLFRGDADGVFLCRRGEDGAHAEVIRAGLLRGERLPDRFGRRADDEVGAGGPAYLRDGRVLKTHMDAVRAAAEGDGQAVVDDERHAAGMAYGFYLQRLGDEFVLGKFFFAELDERRSADDRVLHGLFERPAAQRAPVGHGVEEKRFSVNSHGQAPSDKPLRPYTSWARS